MMTEERRIKPMPFWQKYTLTVAEACSYFHIGERKMREIIESGSNCSLPASQWKPHDD